MGVDDIKADVERDIKSTLATTDTEEFLKKKIPIISTINKSLEMLMANGKYSHSRWALPENPPPSKELLYEPFAVISNAIVQTMPKENVRTDIAYFYSNSSPPESLQAESVAGRPDGIGVQTGTDITALEEKIQTQLETASSLKSVGAANNKEVHEKVHEKEKKHLIGLHRIWWMGIHVVYELRVEKSEAERYSAVKQLVVYMRQVLIKQLDRRFVMGFVILFDELTLILCDRSGVMMTGTPINIHTEWKTLVRIITGFSHMSPEQLGWDTAMKIYCPLTMDIKPSYQLAHDVQGVYKHGRYKVPWVIDIEQDGKVQQYITVATISALRSGEICGRATIVYEVVKFDEKENPEKTYALKRYWRPIQADSKQSELYPSEGEIYAILDEGKQEELKHAIAHHDIKVDGEVDSTLKLIRCGMATQCYEHPRVEPVLEVDLLPLRYHYLTTWRRDSLYLRKKYPDRHHDPSTLVLVERCHTNLLMPMGEEIDMFSCLLELLSCMRDIVEEQEDGHNKLILQRDTSAGNILIFENKESRTFGRLMDYDHAKKASGMREIQSMIAGLSPSMFEQERDLFQQVLKISMGGKAENDVLDTALKWLRLEDACGYIKRVAELFGLSNHPESSLSMTNLGWVCIEDKTQPRSWPDFASCEADPVKCIGTLPYMSGEVITAESLHNLPGSPYPPFVHEAIHDVESLLWVLVRLCLSRSGPGINTRREELDKNSPLFDPKLRDIILRLFEGSEKEIETTKRDLHRNWTTFEETVIMHFHPYFDPLKPLVLRWWKILILGYTYRADEFYNIHSHILRIIDKAIDHVKTIPDNDEAKQTVLERRKRNKENRLATFRLQGPTTPPIPTSFI